MNGQAPATITGSPSELDKLRRRVEALSRKRDEAESRLQALLRSLLPLDDLLADTRRRSGALHEARSARETTAALVAVGEQIDAAQRMLRSEIARHDVTPIQVLGRPVDPAEMEVVGTESHPGAADCTVLQEKLTGFRLGAGVLRPAQVIIAMPSPASEREPNQELVAPVDDGPAPAPPGPDATTRGNRKQPRRTTRSQRRLRRRPSARRGRS
ncbi:nucleotide exchange factor GrpE [Embleya sp. NPDC050493]|uniref:nucleotide exchange factor GrpE n=1 Tax=Embleya sp. NPDC050493 TaxID=3363989 RepID=UPI0037A44D5C